MGFSVISEIGVDVDIEVSTNCGTRYRHIEDLKFLIFDYTNRRISMLNAIVPRANLSRLPNTIPFRCPSQIGNS